MAPLAVEPFLNNSPFFFLYERDTLCELFPHHTLCNYRRVIIVNSQRKPSLTSPVSHGNRPPNRLLSQSSIGFLSVCTFWVCSFSHYNCLCTESLWSDILKQHIPSKSWHPCPWAKSKKSIAAQFCKIAGLILFMSSNKAFKIREVSLDCLIVQQASFSIRLKAWAAATLGVKKEARIRAVADQSSISSLQSGCRSPNVRLLPLCLFAQARLYESHLEPFFASITVNKAWSSAHQSLSIRIH